MPRARDPDVVSVCGPVNDRDCRGLLKLNARIVEGHFAIRVLRGEEYFVVIENLAVDSLRSIDARGAGSAASPRLADGLEDRLSRGRGHLLKPRVQTGSGSGRAAVTASSRSEGRAASELMRGSSGRRSDRSRSSCRR